MVRQVTGIHAAFGERVEHERVVRVGAVTDLDCPFGHAWPQTSDPTEHILKLFLWIQSNKSVHDLAVLKDQYSRDRTNVEAACGLRALVRIEFADLYFAVILPGQFFNSWGEHAARPTPRCPEID